MKGGLNLSFAYCPMSKRGSGSNVADKMQQVVKKATNVY